MNERGTVWLVCIWDYDNVTVVAAFAAEADASALAGQIGAEVEAVPLFRPGSGPAARTKYTARAIVAHPHAAHQQEARRELWEPTVTRETVVTELDDEWADLPACKPSYRCEAHAQEFTASGTDREAVLANVTERYERALVRVEAALGVIRDGKAK